MAQDFYLRVKVGLPGSDGALILARRLEVDRAWSYAVSMWDWFAEKHPEGQVVGPDAAYLIACGAGWGADHDKFCAAMVAANFLAIIPEGFRVKGWKDWAGFHFEKQARDAERKRKSRAGHSDVRVTSRGESQENASSEGVGHCDPSLLSSVSSSVSEGVQGEAAEVRPLPYRKSPPGSDDYPLTAAVLAACWERGWDAEWPAKPASLRDVEAAIRPVGVTAATNRLMDMVAADRAKGLEPKRWLTFHVDVINPRASRRQQPDNGRPDPSQMDYSKPPEF